MGHLVVVRSVDCSGTDLNREFLNKCIIMNRRFNITHIPIRIRHTVARVQLNAGLVRVHFKEPARPRMHDPRRKRQSLLRALGDAEVVVVTFTRSPRHGRSQLARDAQIVRCSTHAQEIPARNRILVRFGDTIRVQCNDVPVDLLVAGGLLRRESRIFQPRLRNQLT